MAKKTPEGKIQESIMKYLKARGIWLRRYNAVSSAYGYPDLDVIYKGHYVGMEVKAENGEPTEIQEKMRDSIIKAGGYCEFVRSTEDVVKLLERIDYEDSTKRVSTEYIEPIIEPGVDSPVYVDGYREDPNGFETLERQPII